MLADSSGTALLTQTRCKVGQLANNISGLLKKKKSVEYFSVVAVDPQPIICITGVLFLFLKNASDLPHWFLQSVYRLAQLC